MATVFLDIDTKAAALIAVAILIATAFIVAPDASAQTINDALGAIEAAIPAMLAA
jgi:hypothetical protein